MPGALLYSTNAFMKLLIQQRYRRDVHYVWCSEQYDSRMLSAYSAASLLPPSSNPADIYRQLKIDTDHGDANSLKIREQKLLFATLAVRWEKSGEITTADKDDMIYLINNSPFSLWRPLVYVIPIAAIGTRLRRVPAEQWGGGSPEHVIEDLRRSEFDIIEFQT